MPSLLSDSSLKSPTSNALLTAALAGGVTTAAVGLYLMNSNSKGTVTSGKGSGKGSSSQQKSQLSSVFFNRLSQSLYARFSSGNSKGSSDNGVDHMAVLYNAPEIVLSEKGAKGQKGETRLWMQLITLQDIPQSIDTGTNEKIPTDIASVIHQKFQTSGIPHVIYDSIQQSDQTAVLVWSESPSFFSDAVRPVLRDVIAAINSLTSINGNKSDSIKILTTMFGRTYSNGHEVDLEFALLSKPPKVCLSDEGEYGIWYPLKRTGSFYQQSPSLQCQMLLEHAAIGRSYGMANYAQDVRLQSFGVDENDNEFVIGIIGKDLHPLTKVIQDMRKTRHTCEFMERLGPFFVGKRRYKWPESFEKLKEWSKKVETILQYSSQCSESESSSHGVIESSKFKDLNIPLNLKYCEGIRGMNAISIVTPTTVDIVKEQSSNDPKKSSEAAKEAKTAPKPESPKANIVETKPTVVSTGKCPMHK